MGHELFSLSLFRNNELDKGTRQINGIVADLRDEDRLERGIVSKLLKDAHALRVAGAAVNEGMTEPQRVRSQRKEIVGEDDDLVVTRLVIANEPLRCAQLIGIGNVEQLLHARTRPQILLVELGRHRRPHLVTGHACNVTRRLQVHPIGFVHLRSDEEVEVVNLVVFAHERRGETELAVTRHRREHATKGLGRHELHLVHDEQTPVTSTNVVNAHLRHLAATTAKGKHRVRRDRDATLGQRLLVVLRHTTRE